MLLQPQSQPYITNNIYLFILLSSLFLLYGCKQKEKPIIVPDDMVIIRKGEFIMGSNDVKTIKDSGEYQINKPLYADEYPEHKVILDTFLIDKYEVINYQFWQFKKSSKYSSGMDNHPVTNVTWFEADRYCKNIGKRLPNADEWEKSARGTDGRIYPWGNEYHVDYANTARSKNKGTKPVGLYEKGKSYYGVYDMIGNASEWTGSWYKPYSGSEYEIKDYKSKHREIRGSSWGGEGHYKLKAFDRISFRRSSSPGQSTPDVGFRCAKSK